MHGRGPPAWIQQSGSRSGGLRKIVINSGSSDLHHCALYDDTGTDILPECNQKFASERDDRRLFKASTILLNPFLEPSGECRVRLMADPQPCELKQRRSKSGIAGFGYSLFAIDLPTLPRRRREPCIRRNLSAIVKVTGKALRPEDGGRLGPNPFQAEQQRWHRWTDLRCCEHGVTRIFDLFHLCQQQLDPIEFAADLCFQVTRHRTTVARQELFQSFAPVAAYRLVAGNPLAEE